MFRLAEQKLGGARRDRTDDLLVANQTLSQLSYGPVGPSQKSKIRNNLLLSSELSLCTTTMVGLGRLELPTSRLSGVRSNHLSYRPFYADKHALSVEKEKRRGRNPRLFLQA
jgi:hypothetical protein